ncbi:UNVERIFIED_CONTAM: hypothetical protein Cloal_3368 [Acetivibrio alkalicellulosi]
MLITFPRPEGLLNEGDLIAITKNDKHMGYGTVKIILEDKVLIDVDNKVKKVFTELYGELIPHDLDIIL